MISPKREFFQAPNAIFDNPDLELTSKEKLVYLYLVRCSNQGAEAFPGYRTIAKKCSISRNTAIDVVKSLEGKGLISVTRGRSSNYQSNLYKVFELPGAAVTPPLVQQLDYPSAVAAPYKEQYINNQDINNYLRNDIYDVGTLEGDPSKTPLLKKGKYGHIVKR